jgi:hypothetical protein
VERELAAPSVQSNKEIEAKLDVIQLSVIDAICTFEYMTHNTIDRWCHTRCGRNKDLYGCVAKQNDEHRYRTQHN